MNIRSYLIILLLLCSVETYPQRNNFSNYTVRSGLPQNTVYKIFQDSRGYLWFGTDGGGLSKFDGRKHTYFNKKDGLASNVVRDIIEDRAGNLWFATNEGVSVFNGAEFQAISKEEGLISNTIVKLFEDSKGRVWVGSTGGGLSLISLEDSLSIKNFGPEDGLSSSNVLTILEDQLNRIWLGFIGGPPQTIALKNNELSVQDVPSSFNYDLNAIYCGAVDEAGNIWLGSIQNGVFKFEDIDLNNSPTIVNYSILNGLKDNYILDIVPADTLVWIATNNGGLQYLKNNKVNHFTTKDGLLGNQILELFSDREGNLWISCMGEGIQKLNGFEFSHFSTSDGLISDQISYIGKRKGDSSLWVASYDNGLQNIKIKNNIITSEQHILNEDQLYNSIKSFDFDQNNNLWIGTQNGLVVWNKDILATVGTERIAGEKINSVLCATSGWVWIGTSSGLSFYNGEYGVFREEDGFINNEIQTIIEASDETIWIGTLGGLASYKDGIMVTYDELEGLSNLRVHSLEEATNGHIYIGTYGGGIFTLDPTKDSAQISPLSTADQLTSGNIYSLTFMNDSTLMVGTDRGADKITFKEDYSVKKIHRYNEHNGFLAIENNINAIYHDTLNQAILFGTVNGLTQYKPALEAKNNSQPQILLEEIKLFNQKVNWENYGPTDSIRLPVNLELPHDQNFISFSFSTIYFTNPHDIHYRYKLSGLNETWFETKSSEIVFQGLEPASYVLEVQSISENGKRSNPYQFSFVITPPFYKTWWFYTACVVFIVICIVVFIQLNLRRLKREKIVLENTVKERTKEIVEQKDIIEEKNQEIMDSITYAKGIQKAILPDDYKLNDYFDDFLVLFKPKDIVSGDFYWAHKKEGKYYFMAADCTGHGVPGAIMSVIGHTCLESTLKHPEELSAGAFLDLLTQNVLDILLQSKEHSVKDGMDVGLCIYDPESSSLQYAGANNPLYLIRKAESGFSESLKEEQLALSNEEFNLFEFKANKQPIGDYEHRSSFDTHTIQIESGDTLYVFSDGFPDQFGGPKGKKYKYKPFKRFLLHIQNEKLQKQEECLEQEIEHWMHPTETGENHEQIDDILIFGLRFK
ncbi:MAG: two-component regulator propeller domain-containing protein [Vicingaceae bacterium]